MINKKPLQKSNHPINLYLINKRAIIFGWSVSLSSDGYSHYGAGNKLTNKKVNPKNWCVLSNTINNQLYQFCLQTDGYMGIRIKYSKLGFSAGTDTLTEVPMATDQQILVGSGTDKIPIYQQTTKYNINFILNQVMIILVDTSNNIMKFSLNPIIPKQTVNIPQKIIINKILK